MLVLSLLMGCTPRRFPVLKPVEEKGAISYLLAKAQEHFIRARDYERRGIYDMAENEYQIALQLDPYSKVIKQQLLKLYLMYEKYEQALLLVKQGRKNDELDKEEKRTVATIYIKMGEIGKAASLFESIENKTDDEIYTLGLLYESMGNIEKALYYYSIYLEKNPSAIQIGFRIVSSFLQNKKYKEAEKLLSVMQEKNGLLPDIYNMKAELAFAQKDTSKGIAYLDSALAIDSLHAGTIESKGRFFMSQGEYGKAIEYYRKLTNEKTDDIYSRTLAILYLYNDQYKEAKNLLRQLLEINMNSAELHYLLGVAEKNDGNSDLARIEFEKALHINPKYKDAWVEYCALLSKEKKYDEALKAAEKFIKELPEEATAYRMKGYVLSVTKDYKGAISALKKAVSVDSTDSYAWFELGSVFERTNDISNAEKAFKKALEIRPDDPLTLNYLGYMWAEKGKNLDSAKILIEKALKITPKNGAILDSYGWVFYQLGKYDSAAVYLIKASERISDDPVIFSHLGDVFYKLKNYKEAHYFYLKALELNSEEKEKIRKKLLELHIIISNQEN